TPRTPPADGVSNDAEAIARFSEPMDPSSVDPFETFRLIRGDAGTEIQPTNLVIGQVVPSADLREFTLRPLLPLAFEANGEYHLDLVGGSAGLTDLAGNGLESAPPKIDLTLDPAQPAVVNGGVALRFSSTDELVPIGAPDVRGQFFYDLERGTIHGR